MTSFEHEFIDFLGIDRNYDTVTTKITLKMEVKWLRNIRMT